jgi:hypothetical protein
MVGTTRPRISTFMKRFRDLGLIERTTDHQLIIKQQRLTAYVGRVHSSDGPEQWPTSQIFRRVSNIGQTSLQRYAIFCLQCRHHAVLTRIGQGAGHRGSSALGSRCLRWSQAASPAEAARPLLGARRNDELEIWAVSTFSMFVESPPPEHAGESRIFREVVLWSLRRGRE